MDLIKGMTIWIRIHVIERFMPAAFSCVRGLPSLFFVILQIDHELIFFVEIRRRGYDLSSSRWLAAEALVTSSTLEQQEHLEDREAPVF
jgi:hypothetical protein